MKVARAAGGYSTENHSLFDPLFRARMRCAWFVAALWFLALHAQAQAIVPPRLQRDPGVRYPDAALERGFFDRVTVTLVLDLDAQGNVVQASPEGPAQPLFDEAALAAARALRFDPALKQGVAVPARIRFRYVFEAPPPVLAGRVVDDETGAAIAGATVTIDGGVELRTGTDGEFRTSDLPRGNVDVVIAAPDRDARTTRVELRAGHETRLDVSLAPSAQATAPQKPEAAEAAPLEVVVRGEKPAPAVVSLSRAEVREMPGAFGDPFRAIEALPGVTPIGSGFPFFYVRGAPPGNVGYFLNGIEIPFLFHVGLGPSVIHPGLVDRVDLYSGGYPARFGRFAGGIVSAETTAPRTDTHGEANVRLFDAGVLAETGFADGRGTLLLGGRYSYTAWLLSMIVPDLKLDYRDYQARITYDVTPRDRVTLFGIGSYDLVAQEQQNGLNVLFGSEFYRLDLAHEHVFDAGSLRTAVTLGYDQSHFSDEGNAQNRSLVARTEIRHQLGERALLRAGGDVTFDDYSTARPKYVDPENPELLAFESGNPSRTDRAAGAWGDLVLDVAPGVEVTPGVRVDWYRSQSADAVAFEPRVAARFAVSDRLTLVHAYGLTHQPPAFAIQVPGRSPAGLRGGLQKSLQASAGAELDLGAETTLTTTLFYNAFLDMTDALSSQADGPPDARPLERSLGSAYGLELFLNRRLTQRLGGFLSYTLARSTRSVGRETFPSGFDRTHVVNAALAYDLGRAWRAGGRVVFYTGTPEQPEARGLATLPRESDPDRTSPFFRLDLRLEKRWNLGESTWISFVIEVLNATLSKEVFGDSEVGPITIPSLGAELGF